MSTTAETDPTTSPRPVITAPDAPNQALLRGRVTTGPTERTLPSGAEIVTLRISVPRDPPTTMTRGSRQRSDWFDCTGWTARVRRTLGGLDVGDQVEIAGALRRRHLGAGGGSLVDVEVMRVRKVPG